MIPRTREAVAQVIKAYDVRGVVGTDIDTEFCHDVGAAFAAILRGEGEDTVAIGFDMRPSSPDLAQACAEGILEQGLHVLWLGLTSTDELYYASGVNSCAGVMFTASHNPAEYNGMKMCRAGARPVGQASGLAEIAEAIVQGVPKYHGQPGSRDECDVLQSYGEYLRGLVNLSGMRPLKVAVDAANGMGGLTVPAVLGALPVTIEPLYFELDGSFPNHEANPLDPENLKNLQTFVLDTGADIGLAFDGDADRCFVVDEKGQPVSPSAICALVASRYLKKYPNATIIHNLITSKAVPEIITECGGQPVRTRVGHSFIKQTMAETGAVFGGEHSAHYYFTEFFNADSGLLAALHILAALGTDSDRRPLSELMGSFVRYEASGEINSTVADQEQAVDAVLEELAGEIASVDKLDGVTVELKGTPAWFNLRASNTEPLLRLNAEAPSREEVDELSQKVLNIIR